MNAFQKLKIEFPGIRDVIAEYRFVGGRVANYLKQLDRAIEEKNIDTVNHCLKEICAWYSREWEEILADAEGPREHEENKKLIEALEQEMRSYTFSLPVVNVDDKMRNPIIFLSHKSDDKKYGDALARLICGLGVKNEQLIYTTSAQHKIPLGKNIYDYLRDNLGQHVFMIYLLSDAYFESPACLNEMGAAWMAKSDYVNMFVPGFSLESPRFRGCAIDANRMGITLSGDEKCRIDMIDFKNKILGLFGLPSIDEKSWALLLESFIGQISGMNISPMRRGRDFSEEVEAIFDELPTFPTRKKYANKY